MRTKYRVQLAPLAESDLQSHHDYIARQRPAAAAKWYREMRRKIRSLRTFPMRCEIIPEVETFGGEYRHLLVGNYRIIFQILDSVVLVLCVAHAAQILKRSQLGSPAAD